MKNTDINRLENKVKQLQANKYLYSAQHFGAKEMYARAKWCFVDAQRFKCESILRKAREWEAVGDWVLKMPTEGER